MVISPSSLRYCSVVLVPIAQSSTRKGVERRARAGEMWDERRGPTERRWARVRGVRRHMTPLVIHTSR